ncbi:MAG TPA: hypothetical protein VKU89_01710 [Solirubrobacteraceae bacterium]|nr:hypothetical protein [Solirubrobacteraceae bacterium]
MSFFDEEADQPREQRTRPHRVHVGARTPPRAPTRARAHPARPDPHALMVRRRILAGAGALILILIILALAGALSGGEGEAVAAYTREVSRIGRESAEGVGTPLFAALAGTRSEQGGGGSVEQKLNELAQESEQEAARAQRLSVPGSVEGAQRALLMALDMRSEGIRKIAARIGTALSGQGEALTAYKQIAGAMEIFLASDVIYSQRVVPLIDEALAQAGASGQSVGPSRFLPNLGWLETATVVERTGSHLSAGRQSSAATGSEAATIESVAVGSNVLAAPPELNHVHSGPNPIFTVKVTNPTSVQDTNVTVEAAVEAAGKRYSSFNVIGKVSPEGNATVEVPIEGVPLNAGAKVTVQVQPPPGGATPEGAKATYEAVFS